MRISAIVLAAAVAAPAPAAGPAPALNQAAVPAQSTEHCPRTTSYYAGRGSIYQGAPLMPRKLTDLPPATTYMAVHRTINGCEVPLTMTEYRTGRRPR